MRATKINIYSEQKNIIANLAGLGSGVNETSESMFVFAFHPGGGVSHDISEDAEEDLSGKGCF